MTMLAAPEWLIVASIVLVAFPLVTYRLRRRLRPHENAMLDAFAVTEGVVFVQVALVVCALPVMSGSLGGLVTDRHFFPGDELVVGWGSAAVAAVMMVVLLLASLRFRRVESSLMVEPWIGDQSVIQGHRMVVLDTPERLAYAIERDGGQIVITSGLVEALTEAELDAVIEHELAHLDLRHRRLLMVVGLLEPFALVLPPLRRVRDAMRHAIEHWADCAVTDPEAVISALVRLSDEPTPVAMASFTAGDTLARVAALADDQPSSRGWVTIGVYGVVAAASLIGLAILVSFWL